MTFFLSYDGLSHPFPLNCLPATGLYLTSPARYIFSWRVLWAESYFQLYFFKTALCSLALVICIILFFVFWFCICHGLQLPLGLRVCSVPRTVPQKEIQGSAGPIGCSYCPGSPSS